MSQPIGGEIENVDLRRGKTSFKKKNCKKQKCSKWKGGKCICSK